MSDTDFITVFDVSRISNWNWFVFGFSLVALAVALIWLRGTLRRLLGIFSIIVAALAVIVASYHWLRMQRFLLKDSAFAEGQVRDFKPMPYIGKSYHEIQKAYRPSEPREIALLDDTDSFVVNNVPFRYSDYRQTSCFHNTVSHGGPIMEGVHVRIWYKGDDILKLQILKSDTLTKKAICLKKLHQIPPADSPNPEKPNGIPGVTLTSRGAFVTGSKSPVPFDQVLPRLAALPRSAWSHGRLMIFCPFPPGLTTDQPPPRSVADTMQAELDEAGMQYLPVDSD